MNKQENYVASLVLFRSVTSNLPPYPPPPPPHPTQPTFPTSSYVLFVPFPSISVTLIILFIPSDSFIVTPFFKKLVILAFLNSNTTFHSNS
ncbi:hypothetical protein L1887_14961 [Cichorium endivia]|nr:hypothetical protein L1887_14961 [Cichorium endivia]